MKTIKIMTSLIIAGTSLSAFGYGTGVSTYPLSMKKKLISAEFTGITSKGGGVGFQGRYTQKISKKSTFDLGLGMGGGERTGRIFAGLDYELFPDYQRQPKVSIKGGIENAREFEFRRNILKMAPTISKGFSFWGEEAYPFVSLPYGVSLASENKTYDTSLALNGGITGNLPIDGYRNLVGTFEATLNLKDSYTGVFIGVSYPIN